MQSSTVALGTAIPALRAARRAIIWQTVAETSASLFLGKYRQPPSRFCELMMSRTASLSLSRMRTSEVMP